MVTPIFRVSVEGFKSVRTRQEFTIGPLTILAGANSSGKSSAMQPLLLIKQTLESQFDPGPLMLRGTHVAFSRADELFWRELGSSASVFRYGVVNEETHKGVEVAIGRSVSGTGLEVESMTVIEGDSRIRLTTSSSKAEVRSVMPKDFLKLVDDLDRPVSWNMTRDRAFLGVSIEPLGMAPFSVTREFESLATGLIHLPGLRGNPERDYPVTAVGSRFSGPFPPYTASVLSEWRAAKDSRLSTVGKQLAHLGLTSKVEPRRVNDTSISLVVGRLPIALRGGAKDLVNIADVGLGVSQTLPVLVALLAAAEGQVVYVEQPEIHLHPRAQVAIADVLIEAANRGVRVIVETHSALLLTAIQERVAHSDLGHLVHLHWFARDREGATTVSSARLDNDGAYGDWPVDFADVALDIETRYLRAALE